MALLGAAYIYVCDISSLRVKITQHALYYLKLSFATELEQWVSVVLLNLTCRCR